MFKSFLLLSVLILTQQVHPQYCIVEQSDDELPLTDGLETNQYLIDSGITCYKIPLVACFIDNDYVYPDHKYRALKRSIEVSIEELSEMQDNCVDLYIAGIMNMTSTEYTAYQNLNDNETGLIRLHQGENGGNCGSVPSVGSANYLKIRINTASSCFNETNSQVLIHEMAHAFSVPHTGLFNGSSTDCVTCWTFDSEEATYEDDYCYGAYCERVTRDHTCNQNFGDEFCDTEADFSYASSTLLELGYGVFNQSTNPIHEDHPDDIVDSSTNPPTYYHPIDNICTPNRPGHIYGYFEGGLGTPPIFFSSFTIPGPCELSVQLYDQWGVPYDPSILNIMNYAPVGCAEEFSPQQLAAMSDHISDSNYDESIEKQDLWSDLSVVSGGDIDELDWTFASLDDLFLYIGNDFGINYRIFILNDTVVDEAIIDVSSPALTDVIVSGEDEESSILIINEMFKDCFMRELNIDMIGVSELTGIGADASFVLAHQGEVTIQQSSTSSQPISLTGDVSLRIRNLAFSQFGTNRVITDESEPGTVLHFNGGKLTIEECTFSDNGMGSSGYSSVPGYSPAIVHFDTYHTINQSDESQLFSVTGCIFNENAAPFGDAVAITMMNVNSNVEDFAVIKNCTFHNNYYTSGAVEFGALHIQTLGQTNVVNCIFSGSDPYHGDPGFQPAISMELQPLPSTEFYGSVMYSLFDQDQWASTYFGLPRTENGNIFISPTDSPGFVDASNADLRLRWDSPCMDSGDPFSEVDFDLTNSDIGWTKKYQEINLSGTLSDLSAGFYNILSGTQLNLQVGNIPEGTVIRAEYGAELLIGRTSGVPLSIGDINGTRTAIVGKLDRNQEDACDNIFIGSRLAAQICNVSTNGLLFHIGPEGALTFQNTSIDLAAPEIEFRHYNESKLNFDGSNGLVHDFDFSFDEVNPEAELGQINQWNSNVAIHNCTFSGPDIENEWRLKIHGVMNMGDEVSLTSNVFKEPALEATASLYLIKTNASLRNCNFIGGAANCILEVSSNVKMHDGAGNQFSMGIDHLDDLTPLILMDKGEVDLFCGYNEFFNQYYASIPMVDEVFDGTIYNHEFGDWKKNYWGRDCDQTYAFSDLYDADAVPDWTSSDSDLESCNMIYIECDSDPSEGKDLKQSAEDSIEEGDLLSAVNTYSQLLAEYPDSRYATEATLELKALGLHSEFGAENYLIIKSGLDTALDSSLAQESGLAVLQRTSTLCLKGLHEDRNAALAELDQMISESESTSDEICATLAKLEVETFPQDGGMASMGDDVTSNATIHAAIIHALEYNPYTRVSLENEDMATSTESLLPASIQIQRAYPNPFNPTTTIEFNLSSHAPVVVKVYNLRGQLVRTLLDEPRAAGSHRVLFQAQSLASGIYLIQVQAESSIDSKKVLLLK